MVQNVREIAENPIIENFRDKNFVIATFFREYHRATAPARTVDANNSHCSSAHNYTWLGEKKLDKTYIYKGSFCLERLLLSSIWPSLQRDCWQIRYWQDEGSCLDEDPCRFGKQLLLIF